MKFKKGDRVEWQDKDHKKYGVVEKGGSKKITIILDILDGAKFRIKGNVSCFSLSDHPLAKDEPNIMDKYSVINLKSAGMNTDGEMWTATVILNGRTPIANVSQGGFGGPCEYFHISGIKDGDIKESYKKIEQFKADAKEWAQLFSDRNMIEPEDTWVVWWNDERPYGKTAAMMFQEYDEQFDNM